MNAAFHRSLSHPPATRRGFTLLEVLLASALGTLVVMGCLGVYMAITRSDRTIGRRFDETGDLTRLRIAMLRTFGTLVMSDEKPPSTGREVAQKTADGKEAAKQAGNRGGSGDSASAEAELAKRPRFLIEADEAASLEGTIRRSKIAGQTAAAGPQRLEVVVSRPPVPADFASTMSPLLLQASFQQDAELRRRLSGEAKPVLKSPLRSVFELRPEIATKYIDRKVRGDEGRWTLWWRPLPVDPSEPYPLDPTDDPNAVPVASDLIACHWRVFHKKEYKDSFEATWWQYLPAYVEMEVQTASGLNANWLFEVEWTTGKEPKADEGESTEGESEEGGRGGGSGLPDAAGGGRGSGSGGTGDRLSGGSTGRGSGATKGSGTRTPTQGTPRQPTRPTGSPGRGGGRGPTSGGASR